jgi:endoglucanase
LKEQLKSLLKELTTLNSVSGSEQDVVRFMRRELAKVCDTVTTDPMGNVFAAKDSGKPGPVFMVAAHSDEIGAVVRSVEKDGYIRFEKTGGMVDALLLGRKVWVGAHLGVIGVKAGHLQSEKEKTEVKPSSEMYIDVGAGSQEEVYGMGITVGTPVAYNSPLEFFTNSDRFCGKAVDDRLGCAILLELMRHSTPPAGKLVGVVTVQEEVGLRGAEVASFRVAPTFAVAVDTMPCGDTPDVNFYKELPVGIGRGPVFQFMSRSKGDPPKGFLMPPSMKKLLVETAQKEGVQFQPAAFQGGNTDAAGIHLVREGIPTGVIALPRRYSHSPVEVGDINDAVGALKILKGIVSRMTEQIDFSFTGGWDA